MDMRDQTEIWSRIAEKNAWLASTVAVQFRNICICPFGILRAQIQSREL